MLIVDFVQQKLAKLKKQVRTRAYDYMSYNVRDNEVRVTFRNNGKPISGPVRSVSLYAYLPSSLTTRFSFAVDASESEISVGGTLLPGLLGVAAHVDITYALAQKIVNYRSTRKHTPYDREVRFAIHDGKVWLTLWSPSMDWSQGDRNYNFDIEKFLLGETRYSAKETDHGLFQTQIEKDEPMYTGTYTAKICTWRYSRFPFIAISRPTYKLDITNGIPVPGKGENSWDCGEDAIYSISTGANDLYEATEKLRESVNRTRLQYGGAGWRPSGAEAKVDEKGPDDIACIPSIV